MGPRTDGRTDRSHGQAHRSAWRHRRGAGSRSAARWLPRATRAACRAAEHPSRTPVRLLWTTG